ncbi:MAG: methionine--tRNA ligase [Planctomycetota bacterium]
MGRNKNANRAAPDLNAILGRIPRPKRMVVTAGMPYANGPLHIGHLAGAHVPADIYARWSRMLIGPENVLFVCGTDDHGSTSELAAARHERPVAAFLAEVHEQQERTLARYGISLDAYSGTSRPEAFERQQALLQDMLAAWKANGLITKRTTQQWYDPEAGRFLPDRLVRGTCPNPKCGNAEAYSDECDVCGHQHEPTALIEPRSALTGSVPEMRETTHLFLDMWRVSEPLREWIATKKKVWRPYVQSFVAETVLPALQFAKDDEEAYKQFAGELPKHRRKYAAGGKVLLQFDDKPAMSAARDTIAAHGITVAVADDWAHRSISRDTAWGIPIDPSDPELAGKTLYVWPDSLIAPISFSQVALDNRGEDPTTWRDYWTDPNARIVQFLGQDNIYFYIIMQGAMWIGSQREIDRLPEPGELQLTDVIAAYHLMVDGEKMSKSRGNFYTGDQLLDEKGASADQIRLYLASLALADRNADFDFARFAERNAFLAGPMNAAFEKPVSACHSKFDGVVPAGELDAKTYAGTARIVARYCKAMDRGDYPSLLGEIENYARSINSLFARFRPHDDRHDATERANALYSCFHVLKNLLIMLAPFAPHTCERLRATLRLPDSVYRVDELGSSMPAGHAIGPQQEYFPAVDAP